MMRLFLYLLALVAGFSPAQASRVALFEPVAVGVVSQPAARHTAENHQAEAHHAHLRADERRDLLVLWHRTAASVPSAPPIFLTDRPRA